MSKTSPSSALSPTPESGVTGSLWRPSWLRWLDARALSQSSSQDSNFSLSALAKLTRSALSGTVETEKQTAWLKRHNEDLRKSNKELKKKNRRLAELQLNLNEILHS